MNLPFYLARRYLISKKSHNAINIISLVSVCGVAIITMALICTLSVYNGFQDLISTLYSSFDPQLKIELVKGRTFQVTDSVVATIKKMPEVAVFTEILEENALVGYNGRQLPATVKGVSDNFEKLAAIDTIMLNGRFLLYDEIVDYTVMGAGLASQLGVNAGFVRPIELYVPRRVGRINIANPSDSFNEGRLFVSGVFMVNQVQYDDHLMICPIAFARELFGSPGMVSSIELRLKSREDVLKFQERLKRHLGSDFVVLNRMEQQADSFRIMQIEKWITFLIMVFILMIATFNVIGSLSMLIIDKQSDSEILRKLGADESFIRKIFLFEGWMISGVGALVGVGLGVLLCWVQQTFGLLRLGGGSGAFIVDAYPVKLIVTDLLWVIGVVSTLGFFAAIYTVRTLSVKK